MKLLSIGVGLVTLAGSAFADLPTYKTYSAGGNATTPSIVYFPSDPNSQIRLVYVNYASDNAAASASFATATTAYAITATNTTTTQVTNLLNSTNGLSAGAELILEHNSLPYMNTISSWGTYVTGTNTFGQVTNQAFVVLNTGGFGVLPAVNDNVYLMSTLYAIPVGKQTNALSGAAIAVGNYGRPLILTLGPATSTNDIFSASAHYDQATQPGN